MPATTNHTSVEKLNQANEGKLPGHLGLVITEVADGKVVGRLKVRQDLVAHTGYLLAGAVLSVADILCAYGVSTAWPEGANGFTTAEVKANFVGTLREGEAICTAQLLHGNIRQVGCVGTRSERAAEGKWGTLITDEQGGVD